MIEYSNETWNLGQFEEQGTHVQVEGLNAFGGDPLNSGGCLFVNYTLAQSAYNRNGSWGILEYIDEDNTPKFDAVADFIENDTSQWSGCSSTIPSP